MSYVRLLVPFLLLAAVVIGFWIGTGKPKRSPVEPFARLERMRYLQELHLVTYHFEEMLVLGVPEKVKENRDQAAGLKAEIERYADSVRRDSLAFVALESHLDSLSRQAERLAAKADSFKRVARSEVSGGVFGLFRNKNKLRENPNWQDYLDRKQRADRLEAEFKQLQPTQREKRRALRRLQNDRDAYVRELARLERKRGEDGGSKLNTGQLAIVTPVRVSAFIDMSQVSWRLLDEDAVEEIGERLADSLVDLRAQSETVSQDAETLTDSIEVLSATRGIDSLSWLKDSLLRTRLRADSLVLQNDSQQVVEVRQTLDSLRRRPQKWLEIRLPDCQIDDVVVDLDTTRNFDLQRGLGLGRANGYFDLFLDLRNEVVLVKEEVGEKAIRRGILDECRRSAEQYIRTFAGQLPGAESVELRIIFEPNDEP